MSFIKSLHALHGKYRMARIVLYPILAIRRILGINESARQAARDMHQQTVIRNLNDLLVEDPVFALKDYEGSFRIGASSHIFARIACQGSYEPNIARVVGIFAPPDRDAVDVGANVGFFTVKLAKRLNHGRVLAVEPTSNALLRLRANVESNGVSGQVVIFAGVAANTDGSTEISFIEGNEEYSTIGVLAHPSVTGAITKTLNVKAATLDTLVKLHDLDPGFLKIDVEGAEHLVLGGAIAVLKNHRPVILCELCDPLLRNNGSTADAVIALIQGESYDIYDVENPDREPGSDKYGNVICFPKEIMISRDAFKTAIRNN
jgi:FkbM family methyltransferase